MVYGLWLMGTGALTVHRNVKGSTMAPTPGSLSTKLDPPSILVVALPNEQPVDMLAPCSVVWYSFKHSRNAVVHGEQPEIRVPARVITLYTIDMQKDCIIVGHR